MASSSFYKTVATLLFLGSFVGMLSTGCTTQCHEMVKGTARCNFYNANKKATIDQIIVKGIGEMVTDTLYNKTAIGTIFLPLRLDTTYSEYFFAYKNGMKDTIGISHSNSAQFISIECGCAIHHTIDYIQFSDNNIDSITIASPIIDGVSGENIKIHFKAIKF